MKKYYKRIFGDGVRSVIADTVSGRITVFYCHNNQFFVNEGIYSTAIKPGETRSDFQVRLEIFHECSLDDIQENLTLLQNHINSL
jgi:hypothetical protein